ATAAAYPLAMSNVVGREAEIAIVERFLAGDATGPATLAIVGEPGIGKTTIWGEAVARARARGALALVARPAESQAKPSSGGRARVRRPAARRRACADDPVRAGAGHRSFGARRHRARPPPGTARARSSVGGGPPPRRCTDAAADVSAADARADRERLGRQPA